MLPPGRARENAEQYIARYNPSTRSSEAPIVLDTFTAKSRETRRSPVSHRQMVTGETLKRFATSARLR